MFLFKGMIKIRIKINESFVSFVSFWAVFECCKCLNHYPDAYEIEIGFIKLENDWTLVGTLHNKPGHRRSQSYDSTLW